MREIKFRAWNKKVNKWYNGDVLLCISMDIDYLIPMQYTGLKDRNGKEIYEGDIVETKDHKSEVKFGHYKEREKNTIANLYGWYMEDGDWQFSLNEWVEVIGNIHENKELLKG